MVYEIEVNYINLSYIPYFLHYSIPAVWEGVGAHGAGGSSKNPLSSDLPMEEEKAGYKREGGGDLADSKPPIR